MPDDLLYWTRSIPYAVVVGDFNDDSLLDIVTANSRTDNIGVFLSSDNGTFSNQMTCFIGLHSQPYSVGIVDIDSDTQLDLVVTNYGSNNGYFSRV